MALPITSSSKVFAMTHTILKSALAPPPATYADAVEAFGRLVSVYIAKLQAWHDHDAIVKTQAPLRAQPKWRDYAKHKENQAALYLKDNSAWKAERLAHHDPYPKPVAHADIVASVATTVAKDGTTTFAPDFEIVNDDPTPEDILATKKSSLLLQVTQAQDAAQTAALLPVGKRRAADIRESDIRANDAKVTTDLLKKSESDRSASFAAYRTAYAEWTAACAAQPAEAELPAKPAPPSAATSTMEDITAQVAASRSPADAQLLQDQESRRAKIDGIARAAAQAMSDIEDLTVDNVDSYQVPLLT
jgi:hypothetical protein